MRFSQPLRSIASNLAFWFCLSSILLTGILSQLIERLATDSVRMQINDKLSDLAYQTTDRLDQGLFERYREVQLMAAGGELGDPSVPLPYKQAEIDRIQDSYPNYAWIGVTDMSGKVLASTKGILGGVDVSARPWFGNALKGASNVGDLHEAKLLAKALPMPASGEPLRFLDIAFTYLAPDGQTAGVLGAHLSWEWARTIEQSVITQSSRRSHIEAMIVSRDGMILLGPKGLQGTLLQTLSRANAKADNPKSGVERWADGKDYLVGYSKSQGHPPFPGFGWTVLVRQDADEALAPLHALQRGVLWSGFGIALLFSLFGVFNARRISQPLVALAAAIRAYRAGTVATLAAPTSRYREINEVGQAFVDLVENLQSNQQALRQLNASLESRVVQRTAEVVKSEERLQAITDHLPVLVSYIDCQQRFRFVNATFERWFGLAPQKLIGMHMQELIGAALYEQRRDMIERVLAGEQVVFDMDSEVRGTERHLHTTYVPHHDGQGAVLGFYAMTSDVSEIKAAERQMALLARHDALTGLPNRFQLDEKLEEAVRRCRRSGQPMAVMFLDIDYFKRINDSRGHAAGDTVLQQFGMRLKASVRATDTVARLAGDEFIVLLEGLHSVAEAEAVAQKILASLRAELMVGGQPLTIGTSIGIAYTDGSNLVAHELMAHADTALYAAKANGRNTFVSQALCRPASAS